MLWNGLDGIRNGLELELDNIMMIIVVILFDKMKCMFDDNMLNDTKNSIKLLLFPWIFIEINIKLIKLSLIFQIIQNFCKEKLLCHSIFMKLGS